MNSNIEICLQANCSSTEKGRVLEKLVADILQIQQFEIVKTVRVTGIEIDVLAKHKVNNLQIIVECKAWEAPLPADVISKLLGNLELRNVCAGWLVTTGPLTKDAEGIRTEWENRSDNSRSKLSFYTADRIMQMLFDAKMIVSADAVKAKIRATFSTSDNVTLMITDIGFYWLVPIVEASEFITSIIVFNAKTGERITNSAELNELKLRQNSYSKYQWIEGKEIDNKITEQLMDEYKNIVPVISGDDWTDYRPARPEDFVGRKTLLSDIFSYFSNVIDGTSSTRLFSIKAPSGMGKSSIVLKLSSMATSRRKSKQFLVYAVDVRTAMSSRYVEMALKSCFGKADKSGFTDVGQRSFEFTTTDKFLRSDSVTKTFEYLKKENKAIVLIFDQFEELFSKKELYGLFDNIKVLSNAIDAQQQNFILGFAWKTDLTIPAEHPAYYMWNNLADRRREFEVPQFKQTEIKSAISIFGKQLGARINPVLGNYLAKQCQGYPWLLKKLCIHVFDLIKEGITQDTVIGKKLNIVDLFERDLSELTPEEDACIKEIARETPADFFRIADVYGNEVIQSLINRRIVIRRASRLILYWDIFRDYVLNKTIPTIVLDYIPQQQFNAVAKMLSVLLKSGQMTTLALSAATGYNTATIDNLLSDVIMFGVAKRENGVISLTAQKEEEIVSILQNFFKNHIMYIELLRHEKDGFDYTKFLGRFSSIYAHSEINSKTKMTYCAKLYNWFDRLGLILIKEDMVYIEVLKVPKVTLSDLGGIRRRNRYAASSHSDLFWGQASPEKMLMAYELVSTGTNSHQKLKEMGLRNAIEALSVTQGIVKNGDKIAINKPIANVFDFILASPTITCVLEKLKTNPGIKGAEVGDVLNKQFARNWKPASKIRYGTALLLWVKYLQGR